MKIYKSSIYDQFHCIASACPDSCCKEWSVAVDADTAAFYAALPGELGVRLRQVLAEEDGDTVMTIENGRCPMWRWDGLCRIQAELGHSALCKTCRDFPRLTHDYGSFQEWGLELSCPEAARLILEAPAQPPVTTELPGGEAPEHDTDAMEVLLRTRKTACALLDERRPAGEALALLLLYGYHAQSELDGGEILPFDPAAALEEARSFAKEGSAEEMLAFFRGLEILSPDWAARLTSPAPAVWEPGHLRLARYFVERYWLQAVSDYDLVGRVKLAVISCLTVKTLGGSLTATAQRYSKEIENDPDNVDALLDAAYAAPAFTDDKLLGLLL